MGKIDEIRELLDNNEGGIIHAEELQQILDDEDDYDYGEYY